MIILILLLLTKILLHQFIKLIFSLCYIFIQNKIICIIITNYY